MTDVLADFPPYREFAGGNEEFWNRMATTLETDNPKERDVLARPHSRLVAKSARYLALASLAVAGLAPYSTFDAEILPALDAACAGIFLTGLCCALWIDRIELLFDRRILLATRGFRPVARTLTFNLSDFDAVVLHSLFRETDGGLALVRCTVQLRSDQTAVELVRNQDEERAEAFAVELSDRLRLPLWRETTELPRRTSSETARQLLGAGMWVTMIAVAGIMMAPVLTRPRSVMASQTPIFRNRDYEAGLRLFWAGRYAEAEMALHEAAHRNRSDFEALNMLAYAQAEQNKLDLALETAELAVAAAPRNGMIIDTLGEMYERRREYPAAVRYYQEALDHTPQLESCETHTKLARTLIAMHRRRQAIGHLETALRFPNQQWYDTARNLLHTIAPERPVPTPLMGRSGGPMTLSR